MTKEKVLIRRLMKRAQQVRELKEDLEWDIQYLNNERQKLVEELEGEGIIDTANPNPKIKALENLCKVEMLAIKHVVIKPLLRENPWLVAR